MSDMLPIQREQMEKIVRAYYANLMNAIAGLGASDPQVAEEGLTTLRMVLEEALAQIDIELTLRIPGYVPGRYPPNPAVALLEPLALQAYGQLLRYSKHFTLEQLKQHNDIGLYISGQDLVELAYYYRKTYGLGEDDA